LIQPFRHLWRQEGQPVNMASRRAACKSVCAAASCSSVACKSFVAFVAFDVHPLAHQLVAAELLIAV